MKIKADFVTNSSTTVYICYVPEDFIISEEFIEKSESYNSYYDPDEDVIFPVEIWHGCWKLHGYQGLWWSIPITQPDKPKMKTKKKRKAKK